MKILLVTGIFPPDHGGPAGYVPAIARGLQERGHEVLAVITLSDSLAHDDICYGFPILRILRGQFRPLRWLQTVLAIRRMARRADVVYLNGLVLEGILATKVFGRQSVVIKVVGDLIWERARNGGATGLELDAFQAARLPLRWRWLRRLQGWYTARADAVIAPSRYLALIVQGWGVPKSHIHNIYNAVSLPSEPAREAPPPNYDLVTVARLVPWKGLAALLEVAAENGWSLRIVGDGPQRRELETLAHRLGACASFAGHVTQERVSKEIRNARLFVLNSSYEGLSHTILEAKAAGVTVLASDAGGTPEIIQHGVDGWLVPSGDNAALAAGIRHLLANDTERARLAEAGCRQVVACFSYAAMVMGTEAVLHLVRREQRHRPPTDRTPMDSIKILDILRWIWLGKSVTRGLLNIWLENRVGMVSGTVIDLGGGGQPSYRYVLHLPDTLFNMDRLEEVRPSFVADLERPLPLGTECVDTLLLFNTLEHVFDYQHIINEMHRILKSGGRALVYVPFMVNVHTHQGQGFFVDDYFRYSQSALDRIFRQAGFDRIEISPLGGLFWVVADLLNIAVRFCILRWLVSAVCAVLEAFTRRFRRFDSAGKFPLGYFVEARK